MTEKLHKKYNSKLLRCYNYCSTGQKKGETNIIYLCFDAFWKILGECLYFILFVLARNVLPAQHKKFIQQQPGKFTRATFFLLQYLLQLLYYLYLKKLIEFFIHNFLLIQYLLHNLAESKRVDFYTFSLFAKKC